MQLRVAQLVPDTQAEGPGVRFAVWVQGCSLRCAGCCNPEMFAPHGGELLETERLAARVVSQAGVEGLSLLGGEPFEQAEASADLARRVREAGRSVMVFSGYTLAELEARAPHEPAVRALLEATDLLVDGRFREDLLDTRRRWIGSSNQVLHFLTPRYSPDDPRFAAPNTVELRLEQGKLLINGWPAGADAFRR